MKSLSQKPVSLLFQRLAFILVIAILVFGCSRSQTGNGGSSLAQGGSTWGDEPGGDLLWSVDRLYNEIYRDATDLVIVDSRLEESEFDSGHILGAIWINYYDMSGDPPISFKPTPAVENFLGVERGIEPTDTIVIYGDGSLGLNAPYRLFWLLEYYGCQDVHIVDGGLKAWNARNYPLDMTPWSSVVIDPATFVASENQTIVAGIQDIEDFIEFHASTNTVLVDSRAPWEFSGEACFRAQSRSGRIPYSTNAWSYEAFNSDTGQLKPPDTVRALLADAGVVLGKDVITVSVWGRRSAANYFLCRLFGYPCSVYQEGLKTYAELSPMQPVERVGPFLHKSLLKNLERAEFGGASAVFGGRIFCFGGIWFDEAADEYRVSHRAWSFEPSTDPAHEGGDDTCWEQLPDLLQPRFGMCAATAPGQNAIYLFGGADGGGNVYTDIIRCSINPATLKITGVNVVQQLSDPLYGAACVSNDADGLIYIIGGSSEIPPSGATSAVYSFDPVTFDLTPLASLPSPRLRSGAVILDGQIYVMGGEAEEAGTSRIKVLTETLSYDPGSDTWTTLKPMATSRLGVKGAAAFGRIYMCGGFSYNTADGMHTTGLVESYDPVGNTWRSEGEMLIPRFNQFMESVDNVVYLIGGYVGFPRWLADVENLINFPNVAAYKPEMAEERSPLPAAQHGGATAVYNDKIYIFGGFENGSLTSKVFEYDPAADLWTQKSDIPYGAVQGASAVATGPGIVVFGGADEFGNAKTAAYSYQPSLDQWAQLSDMPSARFAASAVYDAGSQTILVMGGKDVFCLETTVSYNTATGIWTPDPLPDIPKAHCWATAALINGVVYITGGVGNDGVPLPDTLTLNLSNPVAWSFFTAMPTARYGQGSTVIDGKIYSVGGYVLDGLMTDTTGVIEIFDPDRGRWTSRPDMADTKALTFTVAAKNAAGGTSLFVIGGTALSPTVNYADTIEIAP
jgi:thiosulfate/3-mercaptopyruvate sulfurtransferase